MLVRKKEPPILIFLNLYVTFNKIHGSIWQLNFEAQSLSCKLSFSLLDFNLFEKKFLKWNCFFFLKNFHFWAITSIFWRICLQTRLIYNFRFPIWKKIMIGTPVKFPIRKFTPDWQSVPTDNKRQHLVYPRFFQSSR